MKRSPVDGKPCGEHDGNMTLLVPSCTHARKVLRFRHEFRLLCCFHCTSHFETATFTQHSLISHLLILLSYRKKKKQSLIMSSVKKLLCFCFTDQMSVKQHAVHPVVFLHLNEPRGTSFLTFMLLYVHVDVISFLKLNTLTCTSAYKQVLRVQEIHVVLLSHADHSSAVDIHRGLLFKCFPLHNFEHFHICISSH